MKKILLLIISFFIAINITNAASLCSYEEQRTLEQEAANVKITYEPITEKIEYPDGISINSSLKVSIYNISENLYVTLKNDNGCQSCDKTYSYNDAVDGTISFSWTDLEKVNNFTIDVYSSNTTNCPNEKYKTLYLILPKKNSFSNLALCDDLKDFYLCQEYVTVDEINREDFFNQIEKYQNKMIDDSGTEISNKTLGDKIFEFINQYKYIIIGVLVVIGGTTFVIYRITSKKQKDLGL